MVEMCLLYILQGAGSPALFEAMSRISKILGASSQHEGLTERAIRRSFLGKQL